MDLRRVRQPNELPGIPRARGDGPCRSADADVVPMDSPRSRGWTPGSRAGEETRAGFPALAGMDPRPWWRGFRSRGIPRARGDGPGSGRRRRRWSRDSPRSRGWTVMVAAGLAPDVGFPALAGMDPRHICGSASWLGIPRARGDGPKTRVVGWLAWTDSPRSRGWTPPFVEDEPDDVGFPALAGMDPDGRQCAYIAEGIPRARGDGPGQEQLRGLTKTDSPRSRGWTLGFRFLRGLGFGFPALAGMDPRHRAGSRVDGRDSPRSRGWTRIA